MPGGVSQEGDSNNAEEVAERLLAYKYASGGGVTQDFVQAAKLFKKGAENEDAEAQFCFAWCLANGPRS